MFLHINKPNEMLSLYSNYLRYFRIE